MREPLRFVMKNLCLVTAVDVEFNAATSLLSAKILSNDNQIKICQGIIGDAVDKRQLTILQCGMGAHGFAEKLSDHLKKNYYDALLIAGLAGGLDPALKSGDAVIYELCYDARINDTQTTNGLPGSKEKSSGCDEKASIRCDDEFSGFLFELLQSSNQRCLRGSGVTVNRIITEAKNKASLGVGYHAVAVDMESYDVLKVCAAAGLSAAVLRVISDEVGSDLPDFNRAAEPDGRLNIWRTAVAMAARPMASLGFLMNIRPVINSLRTNLKVVLNV